MKANWKNTMQIIKNNWSTLLLFELFYKASLILIAFPLFKGLLYHSMNDAGLQYLNTHNIIELFKHPIAILTLFLLILLFAFYIFIEVTAVIIYCQSELNGEHITLKALIRQTFHKAFCIVKPKNIGMLIFLLILLPLAGFVLKPTLFATLHIPEYIMDFMKYHTILYFLYIFLILIAIYLILNYIYSFPIVLLEKVNFITACQKSKQLIRGKKFQTLFGFILWCLILIGILFFIALFCIFLTLFFVKLCHGDAHIFWKIYHVLAQFGSYLYPISIFIGAFSLITVLYYTETKKPLQIKNRQFPHTYQYATKSIIKFLILLCFVGIDLYLNHALTFTTNNEYNHKITIIAHRASSTDAPENTLAALRQAIQTKATFSEIDVQETKDGNLVIIHDDNLKRTTGLDKEVWNTTYSELESLDAGLWFSNDYLGEKIPTLDEFLKHSKNKMKLIIELKAKHHSPNFYQNVINLIKKYNMESQVIISSGQEQDLLEIKKIAPHITTNYIVAFAFGDYYELDYVNTFSIESTFITPKLVQKLHNHGKLVYAWTVNKEKNVRKMVQMHVDGIITDNPSRTSRIIHSEQRNKWLDPIVKNYLK